MSPESIQMPPAGRFLKFLAFLFGVSLTTNVVYVAVVGNTAIYISYVISLLIFSWFLFQDRLNIKLDFIDKSVWIFAGIVFLSPLSCLISIFLGLAPNDALLAVLRGLVVFVCGLAIYYVTVRLHAQSKWLFLGLALGLVVNGVLSIIQQVAFNAGSFFTLYFLFPQGSFQVSAPWSTWESLPVGVGHIAQFRPQGMFLETSHLMVFLVCFAPVLFYFTRNVLGRVAIAVFSAYCAVMSLSPNSVFLILEVIVLMFTRSRESKGERKEEAKLLRCGVLNILIIIFFCMAAFLYVLLHPQVISESLAQIARAFSDLNVFSSSDTGTIARSESMLKAWGVFTHYPFGAGWNTESYILQFWYGNSDVASHSFAIRLLIELGFIGLISYFYLIVRHSAPLLDTGSSTSERILGIAVIFLLVTQVSNGTSILPWAWTLLGLSKIAQLQRVQSEKACIVRDYRVNGMSLHSSILTRSR